ncbi:MAG: M23 family metallopeptidase [Actinobacteria bacterium]|nr:MAG: M23 family metallopeptidase [Actinomycetota bacterium]
MGRVLRRAGCALLMTLVVAPAASAHVGGDYGLRFEWPADGVVTSPFGPRDGGFHPGIDIGTLRDLTVRAATPGRVVGAGALAGYDGYGNVVLLALGDGLTSIYAHLARPFARVGRLVQAGQVIGEAGCTGWCTGTHLHFELRYRGTPIDPAGLFDAPLG